jgi:phage terminase small subunit
MNAKATQKIKPPAHLSRASKILWAKICEENDMADTAGQILLEAALGARDRWDEARRLIAREGCVVRDRFAQKHPHPAIAVERDAKATMVRAFKELHLDLEPVRDGPGRPPGKGGPINANK